MSYWSWFKTLFMAVVAVSLGLNQTSVRAASAAFGADPRETDFMTAVSTAAGHVAKVVTKWTGKLLTPPEPSPGQQLTHYAQGKIFNSRGLKTNVVANMQMVGMKDFQVVQQMDIPKHSVREKVHIGLQAKGVPAQVAEAIALQLHGARRFKDQWDDFQVDPQGSAHSYRVIVRSDCVDDEWCNIAIAAFGASFNAAKEIDHYETQEMPEYGQVARVITEHEDGLFGRYENTRTVYETKQVGTRTNKIPILKQKTFTPDAMDDMKTYLENKAMKEVLFQLGGHPHAALAQ